MKSSFIDVVNSDLDLGIKVTSHCDREYFLITVSNIEIKTPFYFFFVRLTSGGGGGGHSSLRTPVKAKGLGRRSSSIEPYFRSSLRKSFESSPPPAAPSTSSHCLSPTDPVSRATTPRKSASAALADASTLGDDIILGGGGGPWMTACGASSPCPSKASGHHQQQQQDSTIISVIGAGGEMDSKADSMAGTETTA